MNRQRALKIANLIFDQKASLPVTIVPNYAEDTYQVFVDLSKKFDDVLTPLFAVIKRHGYYYRMNEATPVIELFFDEEPLEFAPGLSIGLQTNSSKQTDEVKQK